MTNDAKIDLAFTLVKGVIELFKRHQQGENVTADLNELLKRTTALKEKETAIANKPVN